MALRPRLTEFGPIHVVGLCGWFSMEDGPREIPRLWDRFNPRIADIPGKPEDFACYGVCFGDTETDFFYMAAAEVKSLARVPPDMVGKTIPAGRYAVFTHHGGLKGLPETIGRIFTEWLPKGKHRRAPTPDLEVYGRGFDSATGEGKIEIRVPLLR